ncbi:MAG TPA: L-rhamnose mutarotase [Acidobacteriaceae bacterium]|nr:L-rhamnose mutarotase [Acidobacteriaceae bacterium]
MKRISIPLIAAGIALPAVAVVRRIRRRPVRRIGMVIGIKPDRIAAYEALHAASNSGVRDLLAKYHMHNFSIYLEKLENDTYYLFGYYEYTGTDYNSDMEKLGAEPRNQEWLSVTDPMQNPLSGERSWSIMREVYHNP